MAENKTARQLGQEAFERGIGSAPCLDRVFMASVTWGAVGGSQFKATLRAMDEWARGWHAANLAESVSGMKG